MRHRVTLIVLLGLGTGSLLAQDTGDRTPGANADTVYSMGEIVVTATRWSGSIFEAPVAMTVLERKQLQRLRGVGLDEALVGIPGVLAQSRSGTQDVRVTIRGFGARGAGERSNAGTSRGVRFLLDGIPLTEPDGRTSFDLIDASTAGRIEVIRSNASTVWGNATGGVVNIRSNTWFDRPYIEVSSWAGSFGFRKILLQTGGTLDPGRFFLSLGHFTTEGWRVQSAAERTLLHAGMASRLGDATRLGISLAAAYNAFQIPGALTPRQFSRDPSQAQDDTLAYNPTYVQRNERRMNRLLSLALTLSHDIGSEHSLSVTAFGTPKFLQRSERNTYRDFTRYHIGGSALYRNRLQLGGAVSNTLEAGVDVALQDGAVLFYFLDHGERGALKTDKREGAFTSGIFLLDELRLGERWSLGAGARYDRVIYTYESYFEADPAAPLLHERKEFTHLTPKAGITYRVSDTHSLYATLGGGLEVPAGNETDPPSVGGADTIYAINPLLDASSSTTVELGTKQRVDVPAGSIVRSFSYNLALYWIDIRNDFIPYRGGRFYLTAARTRRFGLESAFSMDLAGGLSAEGSLTLLRSTYADYRVDSIHYGRPGGAADLTGNISAGVPELFYTARFRYAVESFLGFSVEVSTEGVGRYFADDYNTVTVPPFTIWHLRAGLEEINVGSSPLLGSFGISVQNLGNRTYAASAWVNPDRDEAGQPIYLEPGLPRTLLVSLGLRWNL